MLAGPEKARDKQIRFLAPARESQ
ncbi:hypothetical protein A2U01_0107863, partial [Trifolium medium]|nr:hypothetical protein [Trifolium medium]